MNPSENCRSKPEHLEIDITQGRLRGVIERDVCIFRGIPFGADTTGTNRFRPPQPAPSWSGVRDAFQFGSRCPQIERRHPEPFTSWYWSDEPAGEDCLVLNVFAPLPQAGVKRPVMFYIHGGGYANGSSAVRATHGDNLARHGDVVVVTLNHRLNLFGFTHFGDMDGGRHADAGNAGLLDIVAALQWVRDNISAFGGDPQCVTAFGHSGGGSKTALLMGLPSAKGLFHRAIDMAGASGFHIIGPDEAAASASAFIRALGLKPDNLAPLAGFSTAQLLAARETAMAAVKKDSFRPVIDGRTLLQQGFDPVAPALSADVPFMLGTADTEATFHLSGDLRNFNLTAQQAQVRIRDQLGLNDTETTALMQAYAGNDSRRTPSDVLAYIATDYLYRLPMTLAAERKAAQNRAPAYMYLLGWRSPAHGGRYRTPHTMVVPLVFGNVEAAAPLLGDGPEPRDISQTMMRAFTAFARTGDPNHPDNPHWAPFTPDERATMVFDAPSGCENDPRGPDRLAAARFPMNDGATGRSIYAWRE